jgi:ABC-type polysaccharide/polyol phosphate transport system ATPase subunit
MRVSLSAQILVAERALIPLNLQLPSIHSSHSMKPIIHVQGVSKIYSRNANAHLGYGIRDLFTELLGGDEKKRELRKDEFYAVDNISFHVNEGDSVALIGRNGSGKTTLLKMMNGLTKLDTGTIIMDGRVQALINLGAGFHPNLSGLENIYNSASLMGLNRSETRAIVDEIIDFSELEEFIESPVQTYSSGMKARLGFAVAITLRPDILLVDEILSVGDYAFQNKCFVRMHELKKQGVTIVLVSHSHTSVIQMCDQALWIHKGKMMKWGPSKDTVNAYLSFLEEQESARTEELNRLRKESLAAIEAKQQAKVLGESLYGPVYDEFDRIEDLKVEFLLEGRPTSSFPVHSAIEIEFEFRLKQPVTDLNVSLCFHRKEGVKMGTLSTLNEDVLKDVREGLVRCRVRIPDFNLNPGNYVLVMPIHEGKSYLYRNLVQEFVVTKGDRMTWDMVDFRYEIEVESPPAQAKRKSFL